MAPQDEKDPYSPNETPQQPINPYRPQAQPPRPDFQAIPQPIQPQVQEPQFAPNPPQFPSPNPVQQTNEQYPADYPPVKKSNRKKITVIIALILALLGGGGAAAYFMYFAPKSPDSIFAAAMSNAMSTSSFTQTTEMKDMGMSFTLSYNLDNIKKPRASTDIGLSSDMAEIKMHGYGTASSGYFKFESMSGSPVEFPDKLKNKWVQVIKDGVVADGASELDTFYSVYDPYGGILGQFIFGSFSEQERKEIMEYALSEKIYEYDSKSVKKETVDGRETFVYNIKIDGDKLKAYNRKVGEIIGISQTKIDDFTEKIEDIEGSLSIDIEKSLLVKAQIKSGASTTTYSKWNQTTLPSEPTPDYQYAEFVKVYQEDTEPVVESVAIEKMEDTKRELDMTTIAMHLEAYYAENGNYPLLSELNDPSWRAEKLKGLSTNSMQDPRASDSKLASKPIANQYSYEVGETDSLIGCDNIGRVCKHFRITAIKSDGLRIIKDSLN